MTVQDNNQFQCSANGCHVEAECGHVIYFCDRCGRPRCVHHTDRLDAVEPKSDDPMFVCKGGCPFGKASKR